MAGSLYNDEKARLLLFLSNQPAEWLKTSNIFHSKRQKKILYGRKNLCLLMSYHGTSYNILTRTK